MSDRVGQQFGNYRLVALLGQGGYAEVYLGQHVRLELQTAIKVLHTHLTEQEAEHFQQEAQTIAKLTHPSIVRILDYNVQEGVPFLVMEYAPNGSLRQRYSKNSVVPLPQVVSLVKQVVAALQYAHDQKFIHRDVKPENMLLGRQQEVLLSDFGLAALAHSSASLSMQEAVGTLPYIAPEQIEGHPRAASDQYALAVVVYEWLCGSRPFEGSVSEVMVQHLTMPPPPLRERVPTIPAEVEQVVLRALAKEPKARFSTVQDFAKALEQLGQLGPSQVVLLPREQAAPGPTAAPGYATVAVPTGEPATPTEVTTPAEHLPELATPPSQAGEVAPAPDRPLPLTAAAMPVPTEIPLPPKPTLPVWRKGMARSTAGLLIGLAVLVIAGGLLGSLSLLAHFGVLGARSGATIPTAVRGGTWTDDFAQRVESLIPNQGYSGADGLADQALYLPLFYGDAQGVIHAGAASEIPTVQNGGISADAKTWTFHLRPHLVWSDGQPYDARDVDFTWKLRANPKFNATLPFVSSLICGAVVSTNDLSITSHLSRAYAPFLSYWVDGWLAPLPAHRFSRIAPDRILKSPENLNPKVVSGPFMMSESVPGYHYTVVRNPRYYRASEGLPYLDKVFFTENNNWCTTPSPASGPPCLQVSILDTSSLFPGAAPPADLKYLQYLYRKDYTLVTPPVQASFEALYFNFHNTVLASHLEVRQAMAMAVDQQALIQQARQGFAQSLCTDHPSAYHPGYDPIPPCPLLDLAAANKLLEDNGWVKGPDGVRAKDGERLEFEYSTSVTGHASSRIRLNVESIIQRDFRQIGIKLDIQNYPGVTFFGSFLPQGKASPPTGAVAGRYDIAEFEWTYVNDPDDSVLLACDQMPPQGYNVAFYCNPALDALYQQEVATLDPGVRQQVFEQIHRVYLTQFPFIVLYSPTFFALVRKGTHNYLPGPVSDAYNIAEWWCDGGKC
jgi:peptide/nickel transport system substrate-binding protein